MTSFLIEVLCFSSLGQRGSLTEGPWFWFCSPQPWLIYPRRTEGREQRFHPCEEWTLTLSVLTLNKKYLQFTHTSSLLGISHQERASETQKDNQTRTETGDFGEPGWRKRRQRREEAEGEAGWTGKIVTQVSHTYIHTHMASNEKDCKTTEVLCDCNMCFSGSSRRREPGEVRDSHRPKKKKRKNKNKEKKTFTADRERKLQSEWLSSS